MKQVTSETERAEMQTIAQVIKQAAIKGTKAAVRAMTEVALPTEYGTQRNTAGSGSKAGRSKLRQSIFDWSAEIKMTN